MPDPYARDEQVDEIQVPPPPGPGEEVSEIQAPGPAAQQAPLQFLGYDVNGQPLYGHPQRPGLLKWALVAAAGFAAALIFKADQGGKKRSRDDDDKDDED